MNLQFLILGRRHPRTAFEFAGEISVITKAGKIAGIRQTSSAMDEIFGVGDPQIGDVFIR